MPTSLAKIKILCRLHHCIYNDVLGSLLISNKMRHRRDFQVHLRIIFFEFPQINQENLPFCKDKQDCVLEIYGLTAATITSEK